MNNIYKILLVIISMGLLISTTSCGLVKVDRTDTSSSQESESTNPTFVSKFGRGSYKTDGELNFPSGIAVDNSGDVYVCEQWNQRISKFDGEGDFLTKWGSTGCMGVDVDNNNNVYVVSTTQHKVSKYDSNGILIKEWGSYSGGDGQFDTPRDVAINKNLSRVYVMDSMNYRIQVFDTDGNFLFKWGSHGSGDLQFGGELGPFGIAIDPNSNDVYVADTGAVKVIKFDLNGEFYYNISGIT